MAGLAVTVPDAGIEVVELDGGSQVISNTSNSVGFLHPGERVDFILTWPKSVHDFDATFTIELDKE